MEISPSQHSPRDTHRCGSAQLGDSNKTKCRVIFSLLSADFGRKRKLHAIPITALLAGRLPFYCKPIKQIHSGEKGVDAYANWISCHWMTISVRFNSLSSEQCASTRLTPWLLFFSYLYAVNYTRLSRGRLATSFYFAEFRLFIWMCHLTFVSIYFSATSSAKTRQLLKFV